MSTPTKVKAQTNPTPQSHVPVRFDCGAMWSMAQQFSHLRLSDETGPFKAKLVKDYAVRARRIAATYARFYLEQEEGCDTAKKGRFYWMALGAFASKTVACTLETWQVRAQATTFKATKEGLGKGNFWLFCDISGWHWYYAKYPGSFDACVNARNASNYVPAVKQQVAKLPWSAQALPKIRQMAVSPHIVNGFAKVREFEGQTNLRRRPQIQLEHLLAIAEHEQGVILQPLIYDDPDFAFWVKTQRFPGINWVSPSLELSFTSNCTVEDGPLKSQAPDGTRLEDFRSRMDWINAAATQFHGLMQTRKAYMESQLASMAGPDQQESSAKREEPFGLSLSKPCSSVALHFDRLSANGERLNFLADQVAGWVDLGACRAGGASAAIWPQRSIFHRLLVP